MDLYFGRKLKITFVCFTNQLAFRYLLPNAKLANTKVKSRVQQTTIIPAYHL